MAYIIISIASFIVAGLTFFSGFGLGSILLPLFVLFFPVSIAVAATAVVHLVNNLFKVILVGKHAKKKIVFLFGIPAIFAAFGGAWLLGYLANLASIFSYTLGDKSFHVYPVKLMIGLLMVIFSIFELTPASDRFRFSARWLLLGGFLSGFFGGLSGHQGALRTMFLSRLGLTKEEFIGCVAVISTCVDIVRVTVYGLQYFASFDKNIGVLVFIACVSAWFGTLLAKKTLKKITMRSIRIIIGIMLLGLGFSLSLGFI